MKSRLLVPVLLIMLLFAACSRTAARPAVPTITESGSTIAIETVEVRQSMAVRINGTASLPPGECLQTGLWINDQPAGWWPSDICIEPDAGAWEMVVALGRNNTPAQLDPQASYEIRAWLRDQPDPVLARFPFQVR